MKAGSTATGRMYRKRAGAGFGAPEMLVRVEDPGDPGSCLLDCGDHACREYANCYEVTPSGCETGRVAYHVSECELSVADSQPRSG